jgi:hypothetical protein
VLVGTYGRQYYLLLFPSLFPISIDVIDCSLHIIKIRLQQDTGGDDLFAADDYINVTVEGVIK